MRNVERFCSHWECIGFKVDEGPAVVRRGGRLFTPYSASATDHHYCPGLLTVDADLTDPANRSEPPTPGFTRNDTTQQYGPGHTRVQRPGWKPDGTPDLGIPVADTLKERD